MRPGSAIAAFSAPGRSPVATVVDAAPFDEADDAVADAVAPPDTVSKSSVNASWPPDGAGGGRQPGDGR